MIQGNSPMKTVQVWQTPGDSSWIFHVVIEKL